eukprot:CAMPEP_0197413738 /NCGR_PEP_ID=MMETSP1170-20131217/569_1 /TAXON_ID=54406 /ORGANISM="Sarcinochrysis sp, Strain CCMP770" /LENGTH=356 /DNA_ID=CAMNT_0042940369 /DNA_START=9 /DNA_END=1080 /DNA_ORIENTATION=+
MRRTVVHAGLGTWLAALCVVFLWTTIFVPRKVASSDRKYSEALGRCSRDTFLRYYNTTRTQVKRTLCSCTDRREGQRQRVGKATTTAVVVLGSFACSVALLALLVASIARRRASPSRKRDPIGALLGVTSLVCSTTLLGLAVFFSSGIFIRRYRRLVYSCQFAYAERTRGCGTCEWGVWYEFDHWHEMYHRQSKWVRHLKRKFMPWCVAAEVVSIFAAFIGVCHHKVNRPCMREWENDFPRKFREVRDSVLGALGACCDTILSDDDENERVGFLGNGATSPQDVGSRQPVDGGDAGGLGETTHIELATAQSTANPGDLDPPQDERPDDELEYAPVARESVDAKGPRSDLNKDLRCA